MILLCYRGTYFTPDVMQDCLSARVQVQNIAYYYTCYDAAFPEAASSSPDLAYSEYRGEGFILRSPQI